MTGKEILAQRNIDMVESDKFSFAVLSLAYVVKRVAESELVGDGLEAVRAVVLATGGFVFKALPARFGIDFTKDF